MLGAFVLLALGLGGGLVRAGAFGVGAPPGRRTSLRRELSISRRLKYKRCEQGSGSSTKGGEVQKSMDKRKAMVSNG